MASDLIEMIDLHIHSTASDGIFSPAEILQMVKKNKIKAFSLTDHDTLKGVRELKKHGGLDNVDFVPGVEVSTTPPKSLEIKGSFHILGYGVDAEDKDLNEMLSKLQDSRKNRNPKIIKILQKAGFDISLESVTEYSGESQLGRPHIARYLVHKGYFSNVDEVFKELLATGKPAYVEKEKVEVKDAIERIEAAGGVAVLAHPGLIDTAGDNGKLKRVFSLLKDYGLKGLEALYPSHSENMRAFIKKEALEMGLIFTGGSDFHGHDDGLTIGKGRNNLYVPYSVYKSLIKIIH